LPYPSSAMTLRSVMGQLGLLEINASRILNSWTNIQLTLQAT
jgi:hypothetical protein